ncbi:hypothetical protein QVM80_29625, partial [Enterobacter hormaechei]|uniref:hypothetical protein n=1 Tax=Enterobacter hormaechei TaxID=158836 RepID=UPI003523EC2F
LLDPVQFGRLVVQYRDTHKSWSCSIGLTPLFRSRNGELRTNLKNCDESLWSRPALDSLIPNSH